jgi:hypothetical protein
LTLSQKYHDIFNFKWDTLTNSNLNYRGSRAIRRVNYLETRFSFLVNYIQTMVKLCLNFY